MDVFRHNHVTHQGETVTVAHLPQDSHKQVARARRTEQRQAPVATASDKVQMPGAVTSLQFLRQTKGSDPQSCEPTHPHPQCCKTRPDKRRIYHSFGIVTAKKAGFLTPAISPQLRFAPLADRITCLR